MNTVVKLTAEQERLNAQIAAILKYQVIDWKDGSYGYFPPTISTFIKKMSASGAIQLLPQAPQGVEPDTVDMPQWSSSDEEALKLVKHIAAAWCEEPEPHWNIIARRNMWSVHVRIDNEPVTKLYCGSSLAVAICRAVVELSDHGLVKCGAY